MQPILDFFDKINDCRSQDDVHALWQEWCTDLGSSKSGTQLLSFQDNQINVDQICSNYSQETVDYYIEHRLFRYDPSSNLLRKTGYLHTGHFDTFSKQTEGKPKNYQAFVDFVEELQIPGQMWVNYQTSNTEIISLCVWSCEEEQSFKHQSNELRNIIVPAAGVAAEKFMSLASANRSNGTKALSPRERDCLLWLAAGMRQHEIADRFSIDTKTVEMHVRNARQKLKARTTHQAIAKAVLSGQIKP